MPEQKQVIAFSHREVAEALVRYQGLREGAWGLYAADAAEVFAQAEARDAKP
jgi:hypothetical protein